MAAEELIASQVSQVPMTFYTVIMLGCELVFTLMSYLRWRREDQVGLAAWGGVSIGAGFAWFVAWLMFVGGL